MGKNVTLEENKCLRRQLRDLEANFRSMEAALFTYLTEKKDLVAMVRAKALAYAQQKQSMPLLQTLFSKWRVNVMEARLQRKLKEVPAKPIRQVVRGLEISGVEPELAGLYRPARPCVAPASRVFRTPRFLGGSTRGSEYQGLPGITARQEESTSCATSHD